MLTAIDLMVLDRRLDCHGVAGICVEWAGAEPRGGVAVRVHEAVQVARPVRSLDWLDRLEGEREDLALADRAEERSRVLCALRDHPGALGLALLLPDVGADE